MSGSCQLFPLHEAFSDCPRWGGAIGELRRKRRPSSLSCTTAAAVVGLALVQRLGCK